MKVISAVLLLFFLALTARSQAVSDDARLKELERKLDQATQQLGQLGDLIASLRAEISQLKGDPKAESRPSDPRAETTAQHAPIAQPSPASPVTSGFVERIIEPELGQSTREETLRARPEIFIQARYSALPIKNAGEAFEPNISPTRIETRWAGKVDERLGGGLEIQFHPAIDGSPEELVNDAFIE